MQCYLSRRPFEIRLRFSAFFTTRMYNIKEKSGRIGQDSMEYDILRSVVPIWNSVYYNIRSLRPLLSPKASRATTTMTSNSKLFQPVEVGDLNLSNRIVLAPVTRFRATNEHVPGPLAAEYYAQRASTPGTLLITEGTFPSAQAGGYPNVPGEKVETAEVYATRTILL